ncbi:hypothetical protein F5Y14DRAFT_56420 [Nemania sp. NC0429]|nr:hypothetical protein F5Y14DRAFT_56420 [Nemania sp. NC0429]
MTATTRIANSVRELDPYLDAKVEDDTEAILEFVCQICQRRRLTISTLARTLTLPLPPDGERATKPIEPRDHQLNLYIQGFEQTVVFPCGHLYGDRCLREGFMDRGQLACPSCGFKMTYPSCGHAIAPAIIPITPGDAGPVRDTFPLTMHEGGRFPDNCKECRWKEIRARLADALGAECTLCAQKGGDDEDHDAHRARHVEGVGIKEAMGKIMMLVQPDFVTRETKTSAEKTRQERDHRDANTALLVVLALTELEETVWRRTATRQLTEAQARRHAAGFRAIEQHLLGLLLDSGVNCRRMW